ncbi:ion channel [Saprospira sp. CCB-QB6]|uniref:ion channel n=1 Tax=Saprospira sp. CCB-QB6 TaxID=3023936 RepID=UPI00234A576C|nr:ion channel [Saprospira sp. CCB-QB6]WCL81213.1 ion channel [Saprospira sp. CCB-QB6]
MAKKRRFQDLGFGTAIRGDQDRLILPNGQFNIYRDNAFLERFQSYQWLVDLSWWSFFLVLTTFYLLINTLFALLYLAVGIEQLSTGNPELSHFWQAFFFSVQTLTTVGYGSVSPEGFAANCIAAAGAFVGLLSFALATGLLFARFSKPNLKLRYSKNILIAPYQDGKALMFRIANARQKVLAEAQISLVASWLEENELGQLSRKFSPLSLEREQLRIMPLNWTVVHPLNEDSPIQNLGKSSCSRQKLELIVIFQAHDDSHGIQLRSYHSYNSEEIIWNARFVSMFQAGRNGRTLLELSKISDFEYLSSN